MNSYLYMGVMNRNRTGGAASPLFMNSFHTTIASSLSTMTSRSLRHPHSSLSVAVVCGQNKMIQQLCFNWCCFCSSLVNKPMNLTTPSDMRDLGLLPVGAPVCPLIRWSSFFPAVCPVFLHCLSFISCRRRQPALVFLDGKCTVANCGGSFLTRRLIWRWLRKGLHS